MLKILKTIIILRNIICSQTEKKFFFHFQVHYWHAGNVLNPLMKSASKIWSYQSVQQKNLVFS